MPRMEDWLIEERGVDTYIWGTLFDHPSKPDGKLWTTSALTTIVNDDTFRTFYGTEYKLGNIHPDLVAKDPDIREKQLQIIRDRINSLPKSGPKKSDGNGHPDPQP